MRFSVPKLFPKRYTQTHRLVKAVEFAVKYFQRQNSLRATGLVELETWKAILDGSTLPGYDMDGNGVVTPEEFPGM